MEECNKKLEWGKNERRLTEKKLSLKSMFFSWDAQKGRLRTWYALSLAKAIALTVLKLDMI